MSLIPPSTMMLLHADTKVRALITQKLLYLYLLRNGQINLLSKIKAICGPAEMEEVKG